MLSSHLSNKRILIGITGGIAAYKVLELIRRLKEQGAQIKVVITKNGQDFVTPLSVAALTNDNEPNDAMSHVTLARWAQVLLIAPASANFIARLATGIADDLLSTICLATTAPILVAPAMNQQMWQNVATQHNVAVLKERGVEILGPGHGDQACGENGPGRMLEAHELLQALDQHFAPQILRGKHILLTAGPTQEALDPVRYFSNYSSGKMGYALAIAAQKLGATVTLISGPTNLDKPHGQNLRFVSVTSAQEMFACVMDNIQNASQKVDIFISVAAVADYRPTQKSTQKIKKSGHTITIELTRNPDIVQAVSQLSPELRPFIIGFAAETQNLLEHAQQKLREKCLDMIIANAVDNGRVFNAGENEVWILHKDARTTKIPRMSKKDLAYKILQEIS